MMTTSDRRPATAFAWHIRRWRAADVAALAALEADIFPDPWTPQMMTATWHNPAVLGWVGEAEQSSTLVGYLLLQRAADEAEVLNLAVAPRARRSGLASALLEHACRMARAGGVTSLYLEVRASNAAALALYQRFEFAAVGRRRGYYRAPPEDCIVMRRDLSSSCPLPAVGRRDPSSP